MKTVVALITLASALTFAEAQSVQGTAEGFASGITGGGDASPVEPADIDELTTLLTSTDPQVIVLTKEYNFIGSEGDTTANACQSWGTDDACQDIITDDCGDSPSVTVTYDAAGPNPIDVASDKTIIGVGDAGVIRGKGLRFRDGATNIIVQNIMITELNPKHVWGGDAISFDNSDLIWIDHVHTSQIGRVHYCFGHEASHRITISNSFLDGDTPYSTSCDGYQYWGMELVGADDQITFKKNYIYKTSGRSPALSGSTLFHACNNVWEDNPGHAIEGDTDGKGLFEGNLWIDVANPGDDSTFTAGALFTSPDDSTNAQCEQYIGRACQLNVYDNSPEVAWDNMDFFGEFADEAAVAECDDAETGTASVAVDAGNTL
ncbi:hypothetical protein FE257_000599 [Aspergillus nanangensis]|uniref:pectin lyase n=1 Tax=Aspergillus nanangensis TaxID=2582783 RepID=A0AAD4GPH1_ASPNN|nr:hypothetical protein FE257_000599 [Aspergillus nanangensis]